MNKKIPFFDYPQLFNSYEQDLTNIFKDVGKRGAFIMQKDLEANSEFRIKYPRGELGQSSGEAELFMLVEHMAGLIESMDEELKGMRNNKINIDFLKEQVSKLQEDVEKLIRNGSGH